MVSSYGCMQVSAITYSAHFLRTECQFFFSHSLYGSHPKYMHLVNVNPAMFHSEVSIRAVNAPWVPPCSLQ